MHELILSNDILITSKTDLKGNILYCNQAFLQYAEYDENHVLFKPHNIIRHKDMPRSVFKLLWGHIAHGKEVFAFVKNLTKKGNFYWVFANFTSNYDRNNNIIGYYSVRRKPNPKAIHMISNLYNEILMIEQQQGVAKAKEVLLAKVADRGFEFNEFMLKLQKDGDVK
ncbi:histidine kinase [Helicobacter didelphidarum]|uniref:Histidine kinase n=1 Tax=Helicobacter didelphidarum TaxID=2040648 RepID=A0A3D8IKL5_9HELI|nr:PAS domain-containing protein [Helicobacter didelphidarum]RDU65792.1 histidine kinase [Helicobacter didelphidarum]